MIFGKISKNMMVKVKAWEPTSLLVNWETTSFAGGLTEFDLCGSKDKPPLCELLSASKRRLVHEKIFNFKSYSVGLQVPHSLDSQVSPQGIVWQIASCSSSN